MRHTCIILALAALANAGFTMDEAMAIHPDGTPVNPEAMRDAMRRGELPGDWMQDQKLVELTQGDSLEAFTDYMQQLHYDRIFNDDGSAKDIAEWRQAVLDDEYNKAPIRPDEGEGYQCC